MIGRVAGRAPRSGLGPVFGNGAPARLVHDVALTRGGEAKLARGSGGRSSRSGRVATVFGANGFLGRYVTSKLAAQGTLVTVPFREEMKKRFLKVTGDLGVVNFVEFDLRNVASIEAAVRDSDVVYNLIAREYPTKNFSIRQANVESTRRIAEAAAKFGVDRFVQVSSFNAAADSPSEFLRTKFEAEQVARAIIPHTTVVRPAVMYGFEDRYLRFLSRSQYDVSVNSYKDKNYPVHVTDVAEALVKIGQDHATAGETFELRGPREWASYDVKAQIMGAARKRYYTVNFPYKELAQSATEMLNKVLWWPVGCADQIERQFLDHKIDEAAKTFADLGMKPDELEAHLEFYVAHLRALLYQDLVDSPKQKREDAEAIHITY
ncbi:uncharacterized protein V1510DRAFT_383043 [Dipodascopsis tothii]|uniref:uncharacterized protein n=1 Tax=Dipodascopsis tothii TaxID=44089 RepID=UPI0034CDF50E